MAVEKPAHTFIRLRYPHMGPEEARIWTEFLRKTDMKFIRIDYDVRVGTGYVPKYLIDQLEYYKRMARINRKFQKDLELTRAIIKSVSSLTKLRIDAVGETNNEIWIFEVKPRAGRSALGQVEAYGYWYVKQFKPRKVVKLAIVCRDVDPNLVPIFEARGIYVFNVSKM